MAEDFWSYLMRVTNNATGVAISRAAEVDAGNVSRWKTGKTTPSAESVVKIARTWGRSPVEALIASGHLSPNEADGVVEIAANTEGSPDRALTLYAVAALGQATDILALIDAAPPDGGIPAAPLLTITDAIITNIARHATHFADGDDFAHLQDRIRDAITRHALIAYRRGTPITITEGDSRTTTEAFLNAMAKQDAQSPDQSQWDGPVTGDIFSEHGEPPRLDAIENPQQRRNIGGSEPR